MLKRAVLILFLVVILAGGVFAQAPISLSAGGGMILGGGLGNSHKGGPQDQTSKSTYLNFGFVGFFDMTYAEVSTSIIFGSGSWSASNNTWNGGGSFETTSISLGLLGKYPFFLNSSLAIFPALGLNYNICILHKENGYKSDKPFERSGFSLNIGGGLDYSFNESIYLRGLTLYNLGFPNKHDKDTADRYGLDVTLGHGFVLKVLIGFRF